MTLGIIDVGTNTIHLVIGILGLNGQFHIILKERDVTRLGEGGLVRDALTKKSTRRAMQVLERYAGLLKRFQVDHLEAVATSAVRDARNGKTFVRQVRNKLGIPLRIISGLEEARLIYLGVFQAHRFRDPTLIITIGGGSAQVIQGDRRRLNYKKSLPLGCARMAQQFLRHDPPTALECGALSAHADSRWKPVAAGLRRFRWKRAVASSATIAQLMMAGYLREHRNPPGKKKELKMTRAALIRLVDWLSDSTAHERIQLQGIDPRREDLLLAAGIVLLSWMRQCGVSTLTYAPGSLREGLVIEHFIRHHRLRRKQSIIDSLADMIEINRGSEFFVPAGQVKGRK